MSIVVVKKVKSYDTGLKEHIADALDLLGGLSSIVKRSEKILVKPNFLFARPVKSAVTTHPDFIAAVVELLVDYGCKVSVGDSPGIGSAHKVAAEIGLIDRLSRYGVNVIEFTTPVEFGADDGGLTSRRFRKIRLARELLDFDRIINLPKLKAHGQMGVTLATKNLYGCVVGNEKAWWHFQAGKDVNAFARLIVEVASVVGASLHILDGIIGMDGNGPSHGRVRNLGIMLASKNPIALDRVVIELMGKAPKQFPVFQVADELKLEGTHMADIEIMGEMLEDCILDDFRTPSLVSTEFIKSPILKGLVKRLVDQQLIVNHRKCTACRRCETKCPAAAVSYAGKIRIHRQLCIRCCCCQEMCPEGAISVSEPLSARLFRRIKV